MFSSERTSTHTAIPTDHIDTLIKTTQELRYTDLEQALLVGQEALALSREYVDRYPLGVRKSLQSLAFVHFFRGEYEQALMYANEALPYYEQAPDITEYFHLMRLLGCVYTNLGDHPTAMQYHLQGLEYARQSGLSGLQALGLFELGMLFSIMGEYSYAIEHYQQALVLYRTEGDLVGEARVLNSCCVDYRQLGSLEQALECGQCSLALFEQIGDEYGCGVILSSLGEAYLAAGDDALALDTFLKALIFLKQRQKSIETLETIYNVGCAYANMEQIPQARHYLEQALALADEAHTLSIAYRCHAKLAEIAELSEDLGTALTHYKQFHILYTQVVNTESVQRISNLEVSYRTRQALAEVAYQQQLREEDQRHFAQLTQIQRDFVATTSHDMRNPLTSIFGALDMLALTRDSHADDNERFLHNTIRKGARRLLDLINDMLELAKIETGQVLTIESTVIDPFLQEIVESLQTTANQRDIALKFSRNTTSDSWSFDSRLMRRAVENLITNAIKFTKATGNVEVSVKEDSNSLHINVSDNGIGIMPDDMPYLFKRFFRAEHERTSHEGTGLGLAIVDAIVTQHGGEIVVESEVGRGSTFSIRLPDRDKAT
ncbi:MAG: hypothetical protein GFH27_549321n66 [Chloroflexi bacterium AL-W]|nr:hypothetical protein [Chloroflexi bacterium AL-N1]NOK64944.1 hypothetical protein [Chloroflexi bacterium AL-N10]NOK76714.1 hypothetical protein [Chloroflexi bacterium AL-N5]NOK84605.1 hypothetical protein [Chloroflexi bacterium AL-W]NOK86570.1 hypothetical protein [Chloroflexi bacterium AL-N15]